MCDYCGKEFKQRKFAKGMYCRHECKRRGIAKKLSYKKHERNEEIRKLRAEGLTYQSIGNQYKLTKQRVHAIVHLDEAEV
jgi:Mor family transcriptional regulator